MIGILASYSRALRLGREPKLGMRARVLALLESRRGERLSTTGIREQLGVDATSLRNLMVRLRRDGWVRCEREGREFVYWVPVGGGS